jgi:hypothetical protein
MTNQEWYEYLQTLAVKTWFNGEIEFILVRNDSLFTNYYYCGYCVLPERPVKETSYNGILTYVPVHGGITLAKELESGKMVYGFDCAHVDDEYNSDTWDIDWLTKQCENMAFAIEVASAYEDEYLNANGNKGKADVIDRYHGNLKDDGIEFDITNNFGAMLNLLCGEL